VQARIIDKDGGYSEYTTDVVVKNVAPTATLANTGPIDEGASATISFSSQSDPSSADTAAGFRYSYACNGQESSLAATYAAADMGPSAFCSFDDNGTYPVKARIFDKDDGYRDYTTNVVVNNVAPTAALGNNGPVNEGSAATISFSNQFDPSNADTAAGFHYAYACDNGSLAAATYGGSGTSTSTTCTFADNGTRTVRARIIDKDNGYSEYTTNVTVSNVPPNITSFSGTSTGLSGPLVFVPATFNGTFKDAGTLDGGKVEWSWDGAADTSATQTYSANGTDTHSFSQTHQYTSAGCNHTATVKITDKDNGSDAGSTATTTVGVGTGAFLPPLANQPVADKLKNGQVLPVKIQVTDCNGAGQNNLSPAIRLVSGDQTPLAEVGAETITPNSVSSADSTGVMRSSASDGSYIYNMRISLSQLNAPWTIIIYPYGNGQPVGPTLRHVIQATK
jgi:hypothetical protein